MHAARFVTSSLVALTLCAVMAPQAGAQQTTVVKVVDGKPQVQSVAQPTPGAGEVLVKVRAAGVNPADWKRAERTPNSGAIPGWDIAGTISAVGPGITGWKVGDAVMGFFEANGGYAQYTVISAGNIAKKPAKLNFEQAAGLPLVAVTAYKALIDVAGMQKGQRVLIHGGAGGVGSAAVQLAAARGAYVIATASEKNHAFLKSIGAKETIDYNKVRFEDQVHAVDIALNTVDEETAKRSLASLKPNGFMVTVAGPAPSEQCAAANKRCGAPDRTKGTPIGQILAEVGKLADEGKFSINVDAQFPLEKAADAWALSKAGHTRGKIVLILPQ